MKQKIKELFTALDKQAHQGVGAAICAAMTLVVLLQEVPAVLPWSLLGAVAVGAIATLVYEVLKEFVVDSRVDVRDIVATLLGCVYILAATAVGIWFNHIAQY